MVAEGNDSLGNIVEVCGINEENFPANVVLVLSTEFSKPTQLKIHYRYTVPTVIQAAVTILCKNLG